MSSFTCALLSPLANFFISLTIPSRPICSPLSNLFKSMRGRMTANCFVTFTIRMIGAQKMRAWKWRRRVLHLYVFILRTRLLAHTKTSSRTKEWNICGKLQSSSRSTRIEYSSPKSVTQAFPEPASISTNIVDGRRRTPPSFPASSI